MIWWRGQGLWIGIIVSLSIVSAQKGFGDVGVAIGCAASASMVFMLKNSLDETTSLFSIPARFWPPLLVGLSILVLFSHWKAQAQEDRLNPEVIVNPIYAEVHVRMDFSGRQIEGVMFGKMVDQADCQRHNQMMGSEFSNMCPTCKVQTVECKEELTSRDAKMFDNKPTAMTTYLSLLRGVRSEREYRLIYWGLTAAESDNLCDVTSEFQKGRKGTVSCIHRTLLE